MDGWPVEGAIAVDLSEGDRNPLRAALCLTNFTAELWNAGHELFRSTPETFLVPLFKGDILDPAFLTPAPPLPTSSTAPDGPPIREATSLSQLIGRISAIYVGSFFHLFKFDGQEKVARRLAPLLSPLPGSVIFGSHGGLPEKGQWCPDAGTRMDCHSPESWEELWAGIFSEVGAQVKVEATVRKHIGGLSVFGTYPGNTKQRYWLDWSVTRV